MEEGGYLHLLRVSIDGPRGVTVGVGQRSNVCSEDSTIGTK